MLLVLLNYTFLDAMYLLACQLKLRQKVYETNGVAGQCRVIQECGVSVLGGLTAMCSANE